jgi:hypothetical protein
MNSKFEKHENRSVQRLMQTQTVHKFSEWIQKLPFDHLTDTISFLESFLIKTRADAEKLAHSGRLNIYRRRRQEVDKTLEEFLDNSQKRYKRMVENMIKRGILNINSLSHEDKGMFMESPNQRKISKQHQIKLSQSKKSTSFTFTPNQQEKFQSKNANGSKNILNHENVSAKSSQNLYHQSSNENYRRRPTTALVQNILSFLPLIIIQNSSFNQNLKEKNDE